MASLGQISVELIAYPQQWNSGLYAAKAATTQFVKDINKTLSKIKPAKDMQFIDPARVNEAIQLINQMNASIQATTLQSSSQIVNMSKTFATVPEALSAQNALIQSMQKEAGEGFRVAEGGIKATAQGYKILAPTIKSADNAMRKSFKTYEEAASYTRQEQARVKNQLGANKQLDLQIRKVGDAYEVTGGKVVDASQKMQKGMRNASDNSIAYMLSLQNMMKKIIHYITFSIGVQMVMMIKKGFTDMIKSFTDFERAATNAATVSGYMGSAFTEVQGRIMDISKELSTTTVFSANDVAKAFYNLASAGIDVGKVTKKELTPILNYAAATQSNLEDATYATLTAMKAFKLEMADSSTIVDVFTKAITSSFFTMEKMQEFMKYVAPIAGEMGLSLEETVAAGMHLVNMGLEGSQAGQRLNMILTKLIKPTDKAQEMLEGLGLTLDDLNPELYSITEIFGRLQAVGFGAAEAATMFRARTAAAAASLINATGDIEYYNQQLMLSEGITESVAAAQEDTLWGATEIMRHGLETAGIEIAERLLPYFQAFIGFITSTVVPAITKLFDRLISILPLVMKMIKIFVALKVILFVFGKTIFIINKVWLFFGLLSRFIKGETMGVGTALVAAAAKVLGLGAATGVTLPLLKAAAVALTVISFGAAAVIASFALFGTGLMSAMGAMEDFTTATKQTKFLTDGLTISLENLAQTSTAVGLAIFGVTHRMMSWNEAMSQVISITKEGGKLIDETMVKFLAGEDMTLSFEIIAGDYDEMILQNTFNNIRKDIDNETFYVDIALNAKSLEDMNTPLKQGEAIYNAWVDTIEARGDDPVKVWEKYANTVMDSTYRITDSWKDTNSFADQTEAIYDPKTIVDLTDQVDDLFQISKDFNDSFAGFNFGDFTLGDTKFVYGQGEDLLFFTRGMLDKMAEDLGYTFEVMDASYVSHYGRALKTTKAGLSDLASEVTSILFGMTKEEIQILTERLAAFQMLGSEMEAYRSALLDYQGASKAVIDAEEELTKVKTNSADATKTLAEAENDYLDATNAMNKASLSLVKAIGALVTEGRRMTSAINEATGMLEEAAEHSRNAEQAQRDLKDAIIDEEEALTKLVDTLNEYGEGSREAANAEAKLFKASMQVSDIEQKVADETEFMEIKLDEYNKTLEKGLKITGSWAELQEKTNWSDDKIKEALKDAGHQIDEFNEKGERIGNANWFNDFQKGVGEIELDVRIPLTQTEKDILQLTKNLVEMRDKLAESTAKQNVLDAKAKALAQFRDKYLMLTNEKLKLLYDNLKKTYDIEEKLYKLREGEGDQLDELFQKMAEEGLVNEDTIALYKELMVADGELMGENHDLMNVFGELTDDQREFAEALINTKEGTEEYDAALAKLKGAGLTEDQIDTIIRYNKAEDRLVDATEAFGEELGPVIDDLIDAGVVSPDVQKAWSDIADNALETAANLVDLAIANNKVEESMEGIIQNSVRLAKSLMDNIDVSGGSKSGMADLLDVYEEFDEEGKAVADAGKTVLEVYLRQMGIWDAMGGSVDSVKDTLVDFFEVSNFDEVSDDMVATAAAMIQIGKATNIWESGMTASALATQLQVGSLENMQLTAATAWKDEDALIDVMENLADATEGVANAIETLQTTMRQYLSLAGGIEPIEFDVRFRFAERLAEEEGNMDIIFDRLQDAGVKLTDGFFDSWEKGDWSALAKGISNSAKMLSGDSQVGKYIYETLDQMKLPNIEFEIGPNMTGDEWETLFKKYGEVATDTLNLYSAFIPVDVEWDKKVDDLVSGEFAEDIGSAVNEMETIFGIDVGWGPEGEYEDLSSYLKDLTADQFAVLMSLFKFKYGIPIDLDVDKEGFMSAVGALSDRLPDMNAYLGITVEDAQVGALQNELQTMFPHNKFNIQGTMTAPKLPPALQRIIGPSGDLGGSPFMQNLTKIMGTAGGPFATPTAPAFAPPTTAPLPGARSMAIGQGPSAQNITNAFASSAVKMDGTFDQISGEMYAVFDTVTGQIIGTYDSTNAQWSESVANSAAGLYGMIDTGSGVFLGTVDTTGDNWKDSVTLSASLQNDLLGTGMKNATDTLGIGINTSALTIEDAAALGGSIFLADVTTASGIVSNVTAEAVSATAAANKASAAASSKPWWQLWQTGGIVRRPTFGTVGERGAEAIVPLEGKNRKFGEAILRDILPKYYPKLMSGEVIGGIQGDTITTEVGDTMTDNFNMYGPIMVQSKSPDDFMKKLKYLSRASGGR